jgi:hypothetical protein
MKLYKPADTQTSIRLASYLVCIQIPCVDTNPFLHCKENPNYVFLFWELRGRSPNFHIHVFVRDLYIPRISPHISLQQNRQTDLVNI